MFETPIVNPRNKMAMKWYGGSQATSWIHVTMVCCMRRNPGFHPFLTPILFVEIHRDMQDFLSVRFMSCSMGPLFVARKFALRFS